MFLTFTESITSLIFAGIMLSCQSEITFVEYRVVSFKYASGEVSHLLVGSRVGLSFLSRLMVTKSNRLNVATASLFINYLVCLCFIINLNVGNFRSLTKNLFIREN